MFDKYLCKPHACERSDGTSLVNGRRGGRHPAGVSPHAGALALAEDGLARQGDRDLNETMSLLAALSKPAGFYVAANLYRPKRE